MSFEDTLDEFCAAVAAGDGQRFAALFCADGAYHDVFYGLFEGRDAIADMLENYFHRDGAKFNWQMFEPVSDATTGYARWLFSYESLKPGTRGKRVLMEGVGCFKLRDGLIAHYADLANIGLTLSQLELPADKLARVLARWADELKQRPEAAAHLVGG